jgi:pantothenate kinase
MNEAERVTVERLVDELAGRLDGPRWMLGIAGVGGSGKTTLAQRLTLGLNLRAGRKAAQTLPMDGFHLPNRILDAAGLRPRKGSPATFNVDAFVELLRWLRDPPAHPITAPAYSREIHDPVPDAIAVEPTTTLLIVEGNYLLLEEGKWSEVRGLLDEVWFLATPLDEAMRRMRARHIAGGSTAAEADRKIAINDWPNAERIAATASRADRRLVVVEGRGLRAEGRG